MNQLIKKPYEISVWEDILTYIDAKGNLMTTIPEGEASQIVAQFYDEKKICVIGSDTMNTPIRAVEPQLVSGINGACTLTFSLYYKYQDEETGEIYDNPFVRFLVNERKIKLRHGAANDPNTKWYDLVIKGVVEDSEQKKFVYTAKSLFVNELSKSGFDLIFDPKLENSTGTITELGEEILKESDWKLAKDCSTLLQYKEEPLYKAKLNQDIYGQDILTGETIGPIKSGKYIYIFYSHIANQDSQLQFLYEPSGKYEINEDRVIINAPGSSTSDRGSNYLLTTNFNYVEHNHEKYPSIISTMELVSEYRGARLVRTPKQVYDKVLDKFVYTYLKDGKEYYGYQAYSFISPEAVNNYITSPSNFANTTAGWRVGGDAAGENITYPEMKAEIYPDIYGSYSKYAEPTLHIKFANANQKIYNSGIEDFRSQIKSLTKNDEYVFRMEVKIPSGKTSEPTNPSNLFKIQIGEYDLKDGVYTIYQDKLLFEFDSSEWILQQEQEERYDIEGNKWTANRKFYHVRAKCKRAISLASMTSTNLGIFIVPKSACLGRDYYITEAQFFPYIEAKQDEVMKMCVPGKLYESRAEKIYYYYPKDNNFTTPEEVEYSDKGPEKNDSYKLVYADSTAADAAEAGYEKVRSITASESNRFNLLQTLCETFECWLDFRVEHEANGKIKTKFVYETKVDGEYKYEESDVFKTSSSAYRCIGKRQQKEISFKEYVGRDNSAGFKYGINLKGIKRNINSDGIVSKIVVKDNSNEYAPNGKCSISLAKANPSTENFLYNFTYYINQGLLSLAQVTNDLYSSGFNGYLGYYTKLAALNADREAIAEELTQLNDAIMKTRSSMTVYSASVNSSEEDSVNKRTLLKQQTSPFEYDHFMAISMDETKALDTSLQSGVDDYGSWQGLTSEEIRLLNKINTEAGNKFKNTSKPSSTVTEEVYELVHCYRVWKEASDVSGTCSAILNADKTAAAHRILYEQAVTAMATLEEKRAKITEEMARKVIEKEALNKSFYHKYSRFIQEGSWISEDYIDNELYYLDAESTLYTSSQPMVNYDIEVIELSQLEGYENYNFSLGDKTHIEDTEFFGWVFQNGAKTPYKEEVIVSEITIDLDSPEKNILKVQNYKTQFEDLFQRVAATTQAIEYSTGQYDKAAGIVQADGTLTFSTIQNSIANNAIVLQNAKDQSVVWDESGITTTCLTKPSEVVRIVSGGIFLSKDGGTTWATGITGSGINASYITSGQIDTNVIRIMNGIHSSFRWDNSGITAYKFTPIYVNEEIAGGSDFKPGIFTRFDQYGLYGIEGQEDFDASKPTDGKVGEDKIWATAKFALTWKGFSLKSDGASGFIRLSSTDDFQVISRQVDEAGAETLITRVQIGDLSGDGTRYGMRIRDDDNQTVLETDSFGRLYLKRFMRVGPDADNDNRDRAKFGVVKNYGLKNGALEVLSDKKTNESVLSKILSITDSGDSTSVKADSLGLEENEVLSIFDDGTILAKRIIIDGGRIGGMSIGQIEQLNLRVMIEITDNGQEEGRGSTIFKSSSEEESKKLRAYLSQDGINELDIDDKDVTYNWTLDYKPMINGTNNTVEVNASQLAESTGVGVVRCTITITDKDSGQSISLI